ncbi:MAG TPA: CPBP family intramembrane glutamic endopeptidase [Polyangiaceae bacterium]|nr:CPBP family intramembrane glutamic endopeptidase [Polyangiaceae bacterium]
MKPWAGAMTAVRDSHGLGAQAERLGAKGGPWSGTTPAAEAYARVVGVYAGVGGAAVAASIFLGRNPLVCESRLGVRGAASWLLSAGLGFLVGAMTVAATRVVVRKTKWARALSQALQPGVRGVDATMLLVLALASASGEELLFRGLLVPLVGPVVSSLFFGVLHQIRGRGRWGWMVWATLMGLLFAGIFVATGSLAGPLVAHAAVNYSNLRYLRDTAPRENRPALGGLLRR